jgi:hypothetical protein
MWSEQCARMVAQKKRCLHCPWSLDFVNTYGDDPLGLWCDAAQATLRFQCRLSKRHMAKIECWHAALRRRLMMRGVQAQGLIFSELVAEVVCDRARSRRSDNVVARVLDKCDTIAVRVEEESCAAPRKRKEPGPWRACVRTQTLGTKGPPLLHALSLSYKQLDTHERDKLTAIATVAAEVQAPLQRGRHLRAQVACVGAKTQTRADASQDREGEARCPALWLRSGGLSTRLSLRGREVRVGHARRAVSRAVGGGRKARVGAPSAGSARGQTAWRPSTRDVGVAIWRSAARAHRRNEPRAGAAQGYTVPSSRHV